MLVYNMLSHFSLSPLSSLIYSHSFPPSPLPFPPPLLSPPPFLSLLPFPPPLLFSPFLSSLFPSLPPSLPLPLSQITKKPQLQSKRRPVSVDCEINYDLSAIPRISSNGGAARGEGSSSSSHSNRNSRVLSELEMRQGVEHFTSPAIDQGWSVVMVTLDIHVQWKPQRTFWDH